MISGISVNTLIEVREFTLSCYRLGHVRAKYTLRVLCWKNLDLAMDGTHEEKEILIFSGLANWKQ